MIAANYDSATITAALSWASNAVETYCERNFEQVLGDTRRLNPQSDGTVLLPDPPVTNVTSVQAWLPADGGMAWVTLTNYDWTPDGLLWDTTGERGVPRMGFSWPWTPKSLKVTYDHGYVVSGDGANLPQPIIDAVIKAAAGYLANPYNLVERKAGDVTYRWSDSEKTSLLDDALLGRYRLVSV